MAQSKILSELADASSRLRQRREILFTDFMKGKEEDFLLLHSRALDDYFCETFERSMVGPKIGLTKNPYAIIALGGYGREEQCVHSDVDLLLLFQKSIPSTAEDLVQEVIYPLWDIGLEVGYATRSLKECTRLAEEDYEVLTSLLDARFICGMSPLYSELMNRIREKVLKKHAARAIQWLIETNRERHEKFGDGAYLLEPNLKEGRGGLRDYHTMLWIARIKFNLKQRRDLEFFGYLSYDEYRGLSDALSFIWNIRNRMHHMIGRKSDRLLFRYQLQLAKNLNIQSGNGREPVEAFLRRLHGKMEFIKQQHQIFLYEHENSMQKRRKKLGLRQASVSGIEIKKDMLSFESPEAILKNPLLLMHIFEECAYLKIPLSAESRRLVKDTRHLANDALMSSRAAVKSFERILLEPAPTFNVLNIMLDTGFLERFIPEFHGVVNRIQYDEYHLHPVDKHLLKTVRTIKKFGTSEDPTNSKLCGKLYQELADRKVLLWAALLHDIGKSDPAHGHSGRGAEMVKKILATKGYPEDTIDTAAFLVQEHLFLVKTATRRDINDEETAVYAAKVIKDEDRLKMLYLLGVADSIATGPKAWNEWTASLLTELFFKVLRTLEKGELASSEAMEIMESKRQAVIESGVSEKEKNELSQLYNFMSPRYLLSVPENDILKHIRLFKKRDDTPFVWTVDQTPDMDTRTVTICAKDTPGLISKIAGVFTLSSIDILDVQVFTWRNFTALDIFTVKPPPDQVFENERWKKAAKALQKALSGELDLSEALREKLASNRKYLNTPSSRPFRVEVDTESSSFFTIIEVFSDDFPGLLYSVTDALFRCRLDIWVAKIATKVDQVVDVFYVRDFDGQKIDSPEQELRIKETIMSELASIRGTG